MTEKKPSAKQPREVLDSEWEDSLRRGQEEEGERGSVEPELAMIHLLRHARAPETLSDQELDNLWADIGAEIAPEGVAWWRKAWVWWTAPVLATAAVVAVIVIQPGASEDAAVARQDQAVQHAAGAEL
ncbi:MAG: hypothetical protein KC431_18885, partial [Myxococcales bacterium]|nr:hypothetical protein [Myxococcales bacterium]